MLTYFVGTLDISQSKVRVRELGACWNDAFRRIFSLNRRESVKLIQYFCGALDFKHLLYTTLAISVKCWYKSYIFK